MAKHSKVMAVDARGTVGTAVEYSATDKPVDRPGSKKKWRKLTTTAPVWNPGEENDAGSLTGVIERGKSVVTRFGPRMAVYIAASEPGKYFDSEGLEKTYARGDVLLVWCSARLRDMAQLPEGTEVRITPKGYDDQTRDFDLEIAE